MNSRSAADKRLTVTGGILGIVAMVAYILAITVPFQPPIPYAVAMLWPMLGIVFSYSLYRYVAASHPSHFNRLAFLFAALGFTTLGIMISVQLSFSYGLADIAADGAHPPETLQLIRRSARLVDMGIDVAWDLLIGTSLILLAAAVKRHPSFGFRWGAPAAILGAALIVLNVLTFPWPPNTRGLVDVGPLIGVYIIFLSGRLWLLGSRMKTQGA